MSGAAPSGRVFVSLADPGLGGVTGVPALPGAPPRGAQTRGGWAAGAEVPRCRRGAPPPLPCAGRGIKKFSV